MNGKIIAVSLGCLCINSLISLNVFASEESKVHTPILDNNISLGYQVNLFTELLNQERVEGTVFHITKGHGLFRAYNGFLYGNYSFLYQPVTTVNQQTAQPTGNEFNRLTHGFDGGIGYAFTAVPNHFEIAPFAGVLGQVNVNDKNPEQPTIYYHTPQTRLGYGGGLKFGWRPVQALEVLGSAGYYPFSTVTTDNLGNNNIVFPDNLSTWDFKLRLRGMVLPFLGLELGGEYQLQNGNQNQLQFSSNWGGVFGQVSFLPGRLMSQSTSQPRPVKTPQPPMKPVRVAQKKLSIIQTQGQVSAIIQPTSNWKSISGVAHLKQGDALRTAAGGQAKAQFDGASFTLLEKSTLLLRKDKTVLVRGRLDLNVLANRIFNIRAYTTQIETKGASCKIEVNSGVVNIKVLEGAIFLTSDLGQNLTLKAGQQLSIEADQPLGIPQAIK